MKLIKQLNEKHILDTRPDSKFKYLDVDSIKGINDVFEAKTDFTKDQISDMEKLIKQYKNRPSSLGNPYRDEVGDDLEMLEYNPDEVKAMINYISKQVKL